MALIGKSLIDFTAAAVMKDNSINEGFNLNQYVKGKYAVLFFYPLDFTFVCPSEIIALNKKIEEFEQKNTAVISVSIDSQFTHLAYKNTAIKDGGIGQVSFPMVADIDKSIARSYEVLHNEAVALRGVIVADESGIIRHTLVNDLPLGRSIDEILRIIDALEYHKQHGEVCPANWHKGDRGMVASPEGVKNYLVDYS